MFQIFMTVRQFAVYLYGEASTKDYRKTVPQIRAGEYEGLAERVSIEKLLIMNGPY